MTHPLSISDKHLHLYLQKTKNRHSFLFRLFSCAKLNIQMIQSHITTQLDLVQNTLNGSFLFYLLAYKSPQEILRSLVLFSRSNIYQFVNQFGNMAFMLVYKHECHVSELIDKLVDVASAEKDKASQDFLWGFVREQVEEEATVQGILDKIKLGGDVALYHLDIQLGARK